ncbi:testis-specific Y-encoded-like protein 1 [Talpa occidentalis]|uniref:testis-specific Y-encoded-like protein 1 n=1 Tax=Talpa occidentalis TaxID=50954 RepID=UPI00188F98DA|nr:testis-specific Y-encoded-like protein 1 [Talpa occidentalis]
MSDQDGGERLPLPRTSGRTTPDQASGDPGSPQCLELREETEASQVTAGSGEGCAERVALPPPPQVMEEGGAPQGPSSCGLSLRVRVGALGGSVGTEAGPDEALPAGVMGAAAGSVAADGRLTRVRRAGEPRGLGVEKALEICGAERSGSEVMAGANAEKVKPEACSIVPAGEGVVGEEVVEEMEVEARSVEESRGVEEVLAAGPRPLRIDLRVNPLEAIQLELDTVNAQADRAFQQLEQKFGRMRRHYLERRNYIIQNIPGFWVTAFRNHPQLAPMIRGQDAEMLRYITNLEVKELRHPRTGCKFKFFFRRNPYFRNKLIVKEYEVRASGRVVSLSTPIIWRRGHEPQSFIRRNQDLVCSFFTWFSDHSLPESDKIAEIIKEDLWPNPLQYYLLREGVRRARRRPIREPVEIPRPFGFQSG